MEFSPFAYNDTRANDFFPLSQEQAEAAGLIWRRRDPKAYLAQNCEVPDDIVAVPDSVISQRLSCIECQKNYRVTKLELSIYRKIGLPIPRRCPDCRRRARLLRSHADGRMFKRQCSKCSKEISSVYPAEAGEEVLCEMCYSKFVYE